MKHNICYKCGDKTKRKSIFGYEVVINGMMYEIDFNINARVCKTCNNIMLTTEEQFAIIKEYKRRNDD